MSDEIDLRPLLLNQNEMSLDCSFQFGGRRPKMDIPKIGLALGVLSAVVGAFASAGAAQEPGLKISASRAAAIHECSVSATKFLE